MLSQAINQSYETSLKEGLKHEVSFSLSTPPPPPSPPLLRRDVRLGGEGPSFSRVLPLKHQNEAHAYTHACYLNVAAYLITIRPPPSFDENTGPWSVHWFDHTSKSTRCVAITREVPSANVPHLLPHPRDRRRSGRSGPCSPPRTRRRAWLPFRRSARPTSPTSKPQP